MMHLKPYKAREVTALPLAQQRGWRLKRYAILSAGRTVEDPLVAGATGDVLDRLPVPGDLSDAADNHGVGFQIIHFAEQVSDVSSQFTGSGAVFSRAFPSCARTGRHPLSLDLDGQRSLAVSGRCRS